MYVYQFFYAGVLGLVFSLSCLPSKFLVCIFGFLIVVGILLEAKLKVAASGWSAVASVVATLDKLGLSELSCNDTNTVLLIVINRFIVHNQLETRHVHTAPKKLQLDYNIT